MAVASTNAIAARRRVELRRTTDLLDCPSIGRLLHRRTDTRTSRTASHRGCQPDLLDERAQRRDQFHLLDVAGAGVEQLVGAHEVGEASRPADRDVETVLGEQEVGGAGHELGRRRRHREQHHRGLLALELVDRADLHTSRRRVRPQRLRDAAALVVVRGDHHEVVDGQRAGVAVLIGPRSAEQLLDLRHDDRSLFG